MYRKMLRRPFDLQLFGLTQTGDLTSQYQSWIRHVEQFRPVASTAYTPGSIVQLAAIDLQTYPDYKTVQLPGTGANQNSLVGVVPAIWPGFNPPGDAPANYTSPANCTVGGSAGVRGTLGIDVITAGFSYVLLDQSGTGAVTLVDKQAIVASRATAGYGQGSSASAPPASMFTIGCAMLPSTGIGSSITAAALAQASQTATVAGTPAVGDTLTVTIQSPYVDSAPGTAQTIAYTTPPLTTAQAATTTTAATALAAYLNTVPSFSTYFVATSSVAIVTVTVNAGNPTWHVNYAQNGILNGFFDITLSGMIANSLTFACAATGGSTLTAGNTTLLSGTGFKGLVPAIVLPGRF